MNNSSEQSVDNGKWWIGNAETDPLEPYVDYVGRLASGELGRLVTARHGFWCNSRHHQTAACIDSMARGVDMQGILRESPIIEDIIRRRVADELDHVADSPEFRNVGHSGVSVKRLRERATALRSASSTSEERS